MQVWNVLHAARCKYRTQKNSQKNRHLGAIAQLCRAISSQLGPLSTIEKKLVKQQYLLHISPQYGELWLSSDWDRSSSLGHPCKFQRVSRLGRVTARHSSSGRQPNFAALNRGRHLYSAGRPSRWAHSSLFYLFIWYSLTQTLPSRLYNCMYIIQCRKPTLCLFLVKRPPCLTTFRFSVSYLVFCAPNYEIQNGFKQLKWPSRSLKVIQIGAIRTRLHVIHISVWL